MELPEPTSLTAPGGIWSQMDGSGALIKGENMILGDVDLGIWPESPSRGVRSIPRSHPAQKMQAETRSVPIASRD